MPKIPEIPKVVETARFGPVTFQVGVSGEAIETLLKRVEDVHESFVDSPVSQIANQLEREVLVQSVFGTNTIEGGELTEKETAAVLEMDPAKIKVDQEQRVTNIKAAYDLAQSASKQKNWTLTVDFIRDVHAAITKDLTSTDPRNRPGQLRTNAKNVITVVGDDLHGGKYKPPQYSGDIKSLLHALVDWHGELQAADVPALIHAPLVHLYFELIHPFWDGNGRVGRVIEATILQSAKYKYAPFALARYYLDHIDTYFTLFNACRGAAKKGEPYPNTKFIVFHLEGMLNTIKGLQKRVNKIVHILLFDGIVRRLAANKEINARQSIILSQLIDSGEPMKLEELRSKPWYLAMYLKLGDKTKQRDLRKLRERDLIAIDAKNRIWPGFVEVEENDNDRGGSTCLDRKRASKT